MHTPSVLTQSSSESAQLTPGDWVIAKVEISEDMPDGTRLLHARPHNIGHVIAVCPGFLPTILWESSGTLYDCEPGVEVERLNGPGLPVYRDLSCGVPSGDQAPMKAPRKIRLIGLVGHAGVGKDTVAEIMAAQRFSFAQTLKRICQEVFGFTDAQLWGPSENRNAVDPRYTRMDGQALTPRHALQQVGNLFRELHPTIWAEAGVRKAMEYLEPMGTQGLAVITDCRFVNEAKAVKAAGGEVWRVIRPGHTLPPEIASHPSETEQDTAEMEALVDLHVWNGGTLDELRQEVIGLVSVFLSDPDPI